MPPAPHIDTQKWRALAAGLRVWLCEVLIWLAEFFGEGAIGRQFRIEARRDLKRAEKGLRGVIVLLALARMSWAEVPGPKTWRPRAFKRKRHGDLRHVTRIIRFRAMRLKDRVLRLREAIDSLDTLVARMAARLEAGIRQLGPTGITPVLIAASLAAAIISPQDSS
jgi:hypothetical protein